MSIPPSSFSARLESGDYFKKHLELQLVDLSDNDIDTTVKIRDTKAEVILTGPAGQVTLAMNPQGSQTSLFAADGSVVNFCTGF